MDSYSAEVVSMRDENWFAENNVYNARCIEDIRGTSMAQNKRNRMTTTTMECCH
jgi:hypothetical protein